jgi:two-component system, cell cycle response regulator CpdR
MARILLAEDDMSVREFARRALESDGHVVTLAHDGGEAAQALGQSGMHFDLLLADVKMPVMDGIALALKVSRDRPDLPILLMTGFADQRERADGLETLVRDVLAKPFTLDELLAAVGRALKVPEPG